MCYVHVQVSKLKTAATSVKSLASKIDDLKHQAKSLDEVIRALKKAINDMEVTTSHDNQEMVPLDPTYQENTASQESSANASNNSSTEVVTMTTTTTTTVDTTFSLATIESEIGPGDDVALKINDELHPTSTASVDTESVEPPRTTAAAMNPGTVTTEVDVCKEKHTVTDVQTEMRMSTTDSNTMENITIKTNVHDLEDVLPMEQ